MQQFGNMFFGLLLQVLHTGAIAVVIVVIVVQEANISRKSFFELASIALKICVRGHVALEVCEKMLQFSARTVKFPRQARKLCGVDVLNLPFFSKRTR